jgi:hypothetical protein
VPGAGYSTQMSVYPNPTAVMFTVSAIAMSRDTMNVTTIDIQGKVVANLDQEANIGINTMNIDGSFLNKPSIYCVKVMPEGETKVIKLLKQ